jgi:FKBP-type peptidyl-prolyl cis-trans isomerase SlpA
MSRLTLCFKLSFENGEIIDEAKESDPLLFSEGDGTLHPALESCLQDVVVGEKTVWLLSPEEGFGEHDPAAVQAIPRTQFPAQQAFEEGTLMSFRLPSGEEVPGWVESLQDETITLDFNHPLAGHYLNFEVHLLNRE